jgi:hypothetical protein
MEPSHYFLTLRRAPDGASYESIGKGVINIEHLPTLYDDMGASGNPSSDSLAHHDTGW